MSRKTLDHERKYSSYELEVLAIVHALKKFRVYLLGIKFKIVTDCSAFTQTVKKSNLSPRIARWVMLLNEFNYEIEHRPGQRMKHVDALSRNPVMLITTDGIIPRIRQAQEKDEDLQKIVKEVEEKRNSNYVLKNKILYKYHEGDDLLVIPKTLQFEIIKKTHDFGHFGVEKVKK